MAIANLLDELRLTKTGLTPLQERLEEMIEVAEDFRGGWLDDVRTWTEAYHTIPEMEEKVDPWPGASNEYLPLIRVGVDGLEASFADSMISNDPFVGVRALQDSATNATEDLSFFYGEYFYDKVVPFRLLAMDYIHDCLTGGTAIMKNRLDRSQMVRRRLVERQVSGRSNIRKAAQVVLGQTLVPTGPSKPKLVEESFVEENRSVRLEPPSLERIFVPPDAGPSMQYPECRWFYEQFHLTWDQFWSRRREGYKITEDMKNLMDEHKDTEAKEAIKRKLGYNPGASVPTIEVLEFYMRLPLPADLKHIIRAGRIDKLPKHKKQQFMDEEGWEEEVVVTYLPRARAIIRIVPLDRIRPDGKRPYVDMRYNRIPRYWPGEGLPAARLSLQKSINSFFNQMIDYGDLQNLPWMLFSPSSMGDFSERMFLEPGAMVPVNDPGGVAFPRFQGDPSFWIQAINMVQAFFERAESVTDFTRGLSPTRPNAPETARATLALISNSQVAFDYKTRQMSQSFVEIFRQVHSIMGLGLKDAVEFEFFNRESQAFEKRFIPPEVFREPVEFEFILNPSRQAEKETNQVLFSILGDIIVQAHGGDINVLRPMAKDLWESHGKKNFGEMWPKPVPAQIGAGEIPSPDGQQPEEIPRAGLQDIGKTLNELFTDQKDQPFTPILTPEEEGANVPTPTVETIQ